MTGNWKQIDDVDDDNDKILLSHTMVPCPMGQQLVGCMFGFLIGFTVYAIIGKGLFTLFAISSGVSFGILGSRNFDDIKIPVPEWTQLCIIAFLVSIPFSSFQYFDVIGLFCLSLIVSILSGTLKFYVDLVNLTKASSSSRTNNLKSHKITPSHIV